VVLHDAIRYEQINPYHQVLTWVEIVILELQHVQDTMVLSMGPKLLRLTFGSAFTTLST
jgi:hypothetical protein